MSTGLNLDGTLEDEMGVVAGDGRTLIPLSISRGRGAAGGYEDAEDDTDDTDGEGGRTCTNLRRSIGRTTLGVAGGLGGAVDDDEAKRNVFRMSIGRSEEFGMGAMWASVSATTVSFILSKSRGGGEAITMNENLEIEKSKRQCK